MSAHFGQMEHKENTRLIIEGKSFSKGTYDFRFQVDGAFFTAFENADILQADLTTDVLVNKTSEHTLVISVKIAGYVVLLCDRCLDRLSIPVSFDGTLDGEETQECTDLDTGRIDLTQYVYDSVCLALPIQRVHVDEGACNKEILALWKQETEEKDTTEQTAFSQLKDLMDNKK